MERPKRYALFLAARDSEYVNQVYGGYFNVFVSAFGDAGETWDLFRVVDGHFPDFSDLKNYDAFVVSGSPFDAYANDLWILKLCLMLQVLDGMGKKILGICFGHQVLCRALGGRVAKSSSGWDIGLRKVKLNLSPAMLGFVDRENDDTGSIIECHQDEVWEVPEGARVLASSDKTRVEMFAIENHIMGIQGHPEYTNDIVCNIIDRLLDSKCIDIGVAEEAKLKLQRGEPDRKLWQKICTSFLKA